MVIFPLNVKMAATMLTTKLNFVNKGHSKETYLLTNALLEDVKSLLSDLHELSQKRADMYRKL